jgi:hypothetical protein
MTGTLAPDPDQDLLDKLDRQEWEHKAFILLPRFAAALAAGALAGLALRLSGDLGVWRACEAAFLVAILAAAMLCAGKTA